MKQNQNIERLEKDCITIATICSHSALQIFLGAKQEGFRTLGIYKNSAQKKTYESFPASCPDEFLKVDDWHDILDGGLQEKLADKNTIIVPHGSFVEYVGASNILKNLSVPTFGNKASLEWESDRKRQRDWLERHAGLKMPRQCSIDKMEDGRLYFVKFCGAKGGRGFFRTDSKKQLHEKLDEMRRNGTLSRKDESSIVIQEYTLGNRYYHHFFFSPLARGGWEVADGNGVLGRLELMGMDRRDETDIDELHRAGKNPDVSPSYTVVGNMPLIARESQLPKIFDLGERVVKASFKLFKPGIVGPFCLETFCTPDTEYTTFEISCRIVAGTNLYPDGSPYTVYSHGDSTMSTGRRIAQEIRRAADSGQLEKILS